MTMAPLSKRGRPPGTCHTRPGMVIRRPVHLTIHRDRHPLVAAWLTQHESRGLAGEIVTLMERALAGRDVRVAGGGGVGLQEVFEVDMSGLMEWD